LFEENLIPRKISCFCRFFRRR